MISQQDLERIDELEALHNLTPQEEKELSGLLDKLYKSEEQKHYNNHKTKEIK